MIPRPVLTEAGAYPFALARLVEGSLPPEVLEARRRQLGIAHRVLDIAMSEVCLQRPPRAGQGRSSEVARQLHMIAVEEDTTLQAIMAEAFNDVFAKRGKPRIA